MGLLGVVLSTIVSQVLGFFWFGPSGFGTIWMENCGRRKEDIKPCSNTTYLIPLASVAAISFILNHVLSDHLAVTSVSEALPVGFVLSVFVTLFQATHAPFHGVQPPAFLVNAGYDVLCTFIIAALVTAF